MVTDEILESFKSENATLQQRVSDLEDEVRKIGDAVVAKNGKKEEDAPAPAIPAEPDDEDDLENEDDDSDKLFNLHSFAVDYALRGAERLRARPLVQGTLMGAMLAVLQIFFGYAVFDASRLLAALSDYPAFATPSP